MAHVIIYMLTANASFTDDWLNAATTTRILQGISVRWRTVFSSSCLTYTKVGLGRFTSSLSLLNASISIQRVSPGPTSTGSTCHRGIMLAIQCLLLIPVPINQRESVCLIRNKSGTSTADQHHEVV
jgi:hypothetical protein